LAQHFDSTTVTRGEIVLLIDRATIESEAEDSNSSKGIAARVEELERAGLNHRAALKQAAREMGLSRPEAYRRLTVEKKVMSDE
jgi:16S rRNA C1402 (ribose-2'-O) methylase RsmI